MIRTILTALTLLVVSAQAAIAAGDAVAGKEKSATCIACHGPTGVSDFKQTQAPIIAGQYSDYILRALKDYKSGERQNPIMSGMVAALADRDMQDIAAFFSRQDGLAAPEITNPVSQ